MLKELPTWSIVRRLGRDVDALQGKIFLLDENLGEGGQASATDNVKLEPAAASSRLRLDVVSEKMVKTEPPRWNTGMLYRWVLMSKM